MLKELLIPMERRCKLSLHSARLNMISENRGVCLVPCICFSVPASDGATSGRARLNDFAERVSRLMMCGAVLLTSSPVLHSVTCNDLPVLTAWHYH